MKLVAKDAVAIASYFNNVNHAYWIKRLRDEQMDLYRNTYGLVSPNDTRWNSNYDCYVSEEDIEDGDTITKTITTNEEIEAYFRTCERMIQEERAAIEDENISNFIFLPAEDVFDLVGETEHPANNKDAKWAIKDLFEPLDINLW
ncbi:2581_t:CDS:2 [Entrophospora sp. SA101]|nr:2581_t:CDS:2 [Entrophospora sp. SA101]